MTKEWDDGIGEVFAEMADQIMHAGEDAYTQMLESYRTQEPFWFEFPEIGWRLKVWASAFDPERDSFTLSVLDGEEYDVEAESETSDDQAE